MISIVSSQHKRADSSPVILQPMCKRRFTPSVAARVSLCAVESGTDIDGCEWKAEDFPEREGKGEQGGRAYSESLPF